MHIISGSLKGRVLKFSTSIRPTTQKVRKAIFDILSGAVYGSSFLELFSGSGAVGIEAFSCGAKEVSFADVDFRNLKIIEDNLRALAVRSYKLYKEDALKVVDILTKKGLSFDIIFADPPYARGLAKNSLLRIGSCDILKTSGFLVIEHHRKEELPDSEGSLMLYKRKKYGETALSVYNRQ